MPQATLALTQALLEPPGALQPGHLELINALQAKRGKPALAEGDLIVRPVRLTGNQLSCLFTRFPEEELQSFAQQINDNAGPLMSAHITDNAPIGTFFQAAVTNEDGALWLDTHAYWLADEPGNKLARDIDAGIINEASIGWSWGRATCSVCGDDWYSWDCPHWPGETYTVVTDAETRATEERLCFLWMLECTFDEGSLVYRGGHPDTRVGGTLANSFVSVLSGAPPSLGQQAPHLTSFQLQATRDMAGLYQKTRPKVQERLGKPSSGQQAETPQQAAAPGGDDHVKFKLKKPNGKTVEVETEEELQALLDEGYTLGQTDGRQAHLEEAAEALGLEPKDLSATKLGELAKQASDGEAYRQDLEARLSAAAVTVEGQGPKAERIAKLGARADIEDLKGLVDDWEAKALELVPDRRLSKDASEGGQRKEKPDLDAV